MQSDKTSIFMTDENPVLYHITDHSNLQTILAEGLHPCIGTNSAICSEKESKTYLTDRDSIPYWVILLGIRDPVLLAVSNASASKFEYSCYTEYLVYQDIPPDNISLADQSLLSFDVNEFMPILCKEYIISLCIMCLWIVRGYAYNKTRDIPFDAISALLSAVDRLDYSCRSEGEWRAVVEEYGADGEYTFCDHYARTDHHGPKLFEQIILFDEDIYLPVRKRLHDTIVRLFPSCMDWETGGWTG